MLGEEIANYLVSAGVGLSASTSGMPVFGKPFPPTAPDAAACVICYGGEDPLDAMGPDGAAPVFERPRFQLLVRDTDDNAFGAEAICEAAKKALRHRSVTLSGVFYGFIRSLGPVFFLKFDENQRPHYAAEFAVMKKES